MRILFLSQYFPPEMGAPSARVSELSRFWAEKGEEVTVVTAFPNHPTGVIPPEYRGMVFLREHVDGYTVLRGWIYAAANKGFFKRLLCFLSYMASATIVGIFKAGKCDLVIATSPQIFCALAGWIVSFVKRRPFVMEVRDLWPDSAIQLNVLKNPILIRLSRWLEKFLYKRASLIIPVSESIQESILKHGIPRERIHMVPNGIDPDLFVPGPRLNEKRKQLGLSDEYVVSYIGTMGLAHGLERIIDAANLLKDHLEIHFLFIGEGARKEFIEQRAHAYNLKNISFLPCQPKKDIPEWLAASDISIVSLLDLPVFTTVLPSKMFEIMASERPILMIAKGECANLIKNSMAGMVLSSGEPQDLASQILELSKYPENCREYGKAGRRFVLENFNRPKQAENYRVRLRNLLSGS